MRDAGLPKRERVKRIDLTNRLTGEAREWVDVEIATSIEFGTIWVDGELFLMADHTAQVVYDRVPTPPPSPEREETETQ